MLVVEVLNDEHAEIPQWVDLFSRLFERVRMRGGEEGGENGEAEAPVVKVTLVSYRTDISRCGIADVDVDGEGERDWVIDLSRVRRRRWWGDRAV